MTNRDIYVHTYEVKLVRDKRVEGYKRQQVRTPQDVAGMLMDFLGDEPNENFVVVSLDARNKVIGITVVYKGSINAAVIRIAEVMHPAILHNAARIVIAHNHPSGDTTPSPEDVRVTEMIAQAGELLDIHVLDHLIVSHDSYTSLKEQGLGF